MCLYSFVSTFTLIELARERTIAVSHLRNMMEEIRSTPFASVRTSFPNNFVDSSATNRYVNIIGTYELRGETITVTYANVIANPLEIRVDLNWLDRRRGSPCILSVYTFKTN